MNGTWEAAPFDSANGFLREFRKACRGETDCLILSSDPDNAGMGDEMQDFFRKAFESSGMQVTIVDVCDLRNLQAAK